MGKVSLFLIIVVASATFYFTSLSFQGNASQNNRPFVDSNGKLHVMGIIINESTVRDAEKAFRSRADSAIFMYPIVSNNRERRFSLELDAYFPSIADHTKIILKLVVDEMQMEEIRRRSTSPRMYPNGIARRNLANEDVLAVQHMKIRAFHLLPSTPIDSAILEAQFGKADTIEILDNATVRYSFPDLGLIALIDEQGQDTLIFTNPDTAQSQRTE